jgi:hypothetical protein
MKYPNKIRLTRDVRPSEGLVCGFETTISTQSSQRGEGWVRWLSSDTESLLVEGRDYEVLTWISPLHI